MIFSIIIINYNTTGFLESCLLSIEKNLKESDREVIVVDNNSSDRKIEKFPDAFPNINFYFRNINDGFGAGCNFGVKKASGKYILFLNPDIRLIDDSVTKLIDFLEKDRKVGACAGLLIDDSNKPSYNFNHFPSYSWEFKEAFGIHIKKTISNLLSNPDIKDCKPFEVDWFHGACLIINKNLFEELGGFDERIFLYYEDVDLQKRIKEKGWKIFCLPEVKMYHATQGSVRSKEGQKIYYYHMHLSKLYYMQKNFNIVKRNIIRLFYIFGYTSKMIILPLRKKYNLERKEKLYHYWIILKLYLTQFNVKRA